MTKLTSVRWIACAAITCGLVGFSAIDASAEDKTRDVKIQDLELKVPAHWDQKPPSNRLRLAQFDIPKQEGDKGDTELVVYSFGGGGGGIDANIKRWIDQFQQEGRKVKLTSGESPQGKYVVAEISGTYNEPVGPPVLRQTRPMPGSRMLAVILAIEEKGNYFLKLTGPDKTVAQEADALRTSFGADEEKEEEYTLDDES